MKSSRPNSPREITRKLAHMPLLILLDYDGTLTDFKNNPEQSRISGSTRSLLYRLRRRHQLIMVTGRYADSLEKVSGLRRIPIVGTHGFEARNLPHQIRFASPSLQSRFKREAESLWLSLQGLPGNYPGIHIEKKPYSSTLHFRGADFTPAQERRLAAEFKKRFRQSTTRGLWALHDGKKMLEAMPRGFSKGKSVLKILAKFPGHFPLYAGDDLGDISVLRVLKGRGLRIAVGGRIPDRYCDLRFESPRRFVQWLRGLA